MKQTGIYLVVAKDGIYIGQSRNIKKRWSVLKARKRPNELLYQSIIKNGVGSLEFKILHGLPKDVEQSILDSYEQLYISQYRECGFNLFNKQRGGKWGGGNKVSEETKEKIRSKLTGIPLKPERIEKMKANRVLTTESKQKISESLKKY